MGISLGFFLFRVLYFLDRKHNQGRVFPGATWVRNAALDWIEDMAKHLPLPRTQTGTEESLPGDLTQAAGFQSGSPPPATGQGSGCTQGDGEGRHPGRGLP